MSDELGEEIAKYGWIIGTPVGAAMGAYHGAQQDGVVGFFIGFVGGGFAGGFIGSLGLFILIPAVIAMAMMKGCEYMSGSAKRKVEHYPSSIALAHDESRANTAQHPQSRQ